MLYMHVCVYIYIYIYMYVCICYIILHEYMYVLCQLLQCLAALFFGKVVQYNVNVRVIADTAWFAFLS